KRSAQLSSERKLNDAQSVIHTIHELSSLPAARAQFSHTRQRPLASIVLERQRARYRIITLPASQPYRGPADGLLSAWLETESALCAVRPVGVVVDVALAPPLDLHLRFAVLPSGVAIELSAECARGLPRTRLTSFKREPFREIEHVRTTYAGSSRKDVRAAQ